jgi:PAS domain S-box-containing protein
MFRALFESTKTSVAILDLNGLITGVNPAFRDLLGADLPWEDGIPFLEVVETTDKEAVSRELEVLGSGGSEKFEAARRFRPTHEGPVVWAQTAMVLIRGTDGVPDQLMAIMEELKG